MRVVDKSVKKAVLPFHCVKVVRNNKASESETREKVIDWWYWGVLSNFTPAVEFSGRHLQINTRSIFSRERGARDKTQSLFLLGQMERSVELYSHSFSS